MTICNTHIVNDTGGLIVSVFIIYFVQLLVKVDLYDSRASAYLSHTIFTTSFDFFVSLLFLFIVRVKLMTKRPFFVLFVFHFAQLPCLLYVDFSVPISNKTRIVHGGNHLRNSQLVVLTTHFFYSFSLVVCRCFLITLFLLIVSLFPRGFGYRRVHVHLQ